MNVYGMYAEMQRTMLVQVNNVSECVICEWYKLWVTTILDKRLKRWLFSVIIINIILSSFKLSIDITISYLNTVPFIRMRSKRENGYWGNTALFATHLMHFLPQIKVKRLGFTVFANTLSKRNLYQH